MLQLTPSVLTLGNTGSPSTVQLRLEGGRPGPSFCRVRVCDSGGYGNGTNATLAGARGTTLVETHTADKDLTFRSSVAANAAGTLTLTGVVVDGERVTLGGRTYEFDTHAVARITSGRIRADLSGYTTASKGTLRLDTIPTAGDTMTVGGRPYLFKAAADADAPSEISIGVSLAAAITNLLAAINGTDDLNTAHGSVSAAAGTGTAATTTLTSDATAPSNGDTVTLGSKTYTFQTTLTNVNGNVLIGASAAAALDNLKAAVNLSAGAGTTYATATTAHTQFTATTNTDTTQVFSATLAPGSQGNALATTETSSHLSFTSTVAAGAVDKIILTARAGGVAGDLLATTETFTATNNTFDAATLGTTTAGADCTAANAILGLVAAINADTGALVTAADGAGNTLVATAKDAGSAGNDLGSTKVMANATWGAAALSGGRDQLDGLIHLTLTNATAETVTLRFGPSGLSPQDGDYTPVLEVTHAA